MTFPETSEQNYMPLRVKERIQEAKDKKFKKLDLSSTGLTEVPGDVWELEHLEVLYLQDNKLKSLSKSIGKLSNLIELYLGNNKLKCLPESIAKLSNLTRLNLGNNKLNCLPESIAKLSNLTRLNLENNKLESLPESITKLSKLTEFYLSRNQLISLPESISRLSNLTMFFLSDNKLTSLPESITKLSNLTMLNLRSNQLISLPELIGKLSYLTRLHLSYNQLKSVPESIGKLYNLTELYLGGNQLKSVPESIGKLSNLTELYLGGNELTSVPESITKLSNLTLLSLRSNQLTSVPESITKLSNLTLLYLGGNELTSVPELITKLSNLTWLSLRRNRLKNLPESITKLSHLTRLDLGRNQLKSLPESITKLSHLTKLYLGNNQLKSLPESITKLSHLTYLSLDDNQLKSFPESIINLSNLTDLSLRSNQLTSLPEPITKLSNLTELNLGNNQLKILPESISKLSNLTELNLGNNQLKILPESISKLSNLTELNLGNNQLKILPESISKIFNLTKLYLGNNQLKSLAESITKLSNLIYISLDNNQLESLPESITKLSHLTKLYLGNNQLKSLPESITKLSNLTELFLDDNQLKSLPESIGRLSNLTTLGLHNNPLETPPIEIATQGIEEIRNYFRQEREKGMDYIYEAKLLIVGEGGAGKTTLANKIIDPNYQLKDEDTTKGIEVNQYKFQTENQNDFQINIWDFGGQEIYHATHQFFLTKRSLYILVADTRKEDTDFYYWLNVVELLSSNSPLLIVKNEKQEREREINQRALQGQFTNIKEILATNLATNRGLAEIIREIQHHISKLPHIGSRLPKTWKKVREILELDSRNHISLEEYLSICEQNGFEKTEYKLQLSGYLHDLGVCLHFQDDPLLNKTVILKPEWGTAAVYKALDSQTVRNKFGKFNKDDLTNIWNEKKYLNMRDELLQLMIRFKLCYKIPGNSQTYIAPQLLTENQPEYDWDENNNLILSYTYEFMPKGIITQFIVAMHKDIEEQKYVWKSGVILNKNETRAEVIEDYNRRKIKIRVSGKQKRDLMTIVTHELDKIHSSYNNRLKYNQLIPCNCNICQNNQNPTSYEFKILQERINNGKETIECNYPPFNEVNIRSLIDDVININEYRILSQSNSYPNKIYNNNKYYINNSTDFTIDTKEAKNQFIRNKTTNPKIDQSQKIENKNGNIVGNVLGDHSNIEGKIRTNSPPPKIEKYHKFGWLNLLTWIQNRQIIYYLIPVTIGICLFIIYSKLFPSSFPKLIEKIQDIFPALQVDRESHKNK